MKAVIVAIGDELLIGQVLDTNSQYISQQLENIGCSVVEKVNISDKKETIIHTLERFQNQVDMVVITGGLGPTKDDVTKNALIEYFQDTLVRNQKTYNNVKNIIENIYNRSISEINEQQADVPSKAKILYNAVGTAPGLLMIKEQTTFVSMPGVPHEMKHIVDTHLLSYIQREFTLKNIYHHTVVTAGIGESLLAETIFQWEHQLAEENISLAYLPQPGIVKLRLSKIGNKEEKVEEDVKRQVEKLKKIIPEYIISEDESILLIDKVIELLLAQNKTISFAESCTGGLFTQKFAERQGASQYLKGGVVTYATESKVNILSVPQNTIDTHTVVSEEVAQSMAKGALSIYQSDYSIATTGNAGPTKGDSDKEIGTVCVAVATPNNTVSKTFQLGQPRTKVIELAIQKGLLMLYKELQKEKI